MVQFKNLFVTNFNEETPLFALGLTIMIFLFLTLQGIFVQFPGEHAANVYSGLLFFSILVLMLEFVTVHILRKQSIIQVIFLGKYKDFFLAIVAGTIIGFVFASQPGFIIGIPERLSVAESSLQFLLNLSNELNFFYVVIAAAIAETVFFRGIMFPLIATLLGKIGIPSAPIVSAVLVNMTFGLYHFVAYGGNESFIIGAFLFGMIGTIGNSVFKSLGFEVSAHFVNNFLALTRVVG